MTYPVFLWISFKWKSLMNFHFDMSEDDLINLTSKRQSGYMNKIFSFVIGVEVSFLQSSTYDTRSVFKMMHCFSGKRPQLEISNEILCICFILRKTEPCFAVSASRSFLKAAQMRKIKVKKWVLMAQADRIFTCEFWKVCVVIPPPIHHSLFFSLKAACS